jgi:excisionase family DNA binding protein
MEGWMTLKQLAEYLGVSSIGSLRVQIERGVLKAERLGNQWIVRDEEAARYKAEHRAGEGKRGRPPKERGGGG